MEYERKLENENICNNSKKEIQGGKGKYEASTGEPIMGQLSDNAMVDVKRKNAGPSKNCKLRGY